MLLRIKIFRKDFAVLLLYSFCLLLLSFSLNVHITEAACGDGILDPGEECDGGLFIGGAVTCEDIGDTNPATSGNALVCTGSCLRNNIASACSGGFQAPPKPGDVPEDFKGSILNITNWLLGFVTMIAVLVIIWGGINYLTSAGDEDKARTGKKTLTYALLGLVVIGIAYALVNVIIATILG